MGNLKHALNLAVFLFVLWLLLSGHYTSVLLLCGVLSTLLVVLLSARSDLIDRQTQPILIRPSVLLYWMWLGWQVIKSNIDVARRILDPRMPISPNILTVKAGQKTDLGRVTYANSITLVPGTVSMDVEDDEIVVHALTQRAADELMDGEMNRRVCDAERIF